MLLPFAGQVRAVADPSGGSEPVLVTGATGFIGSAVVRALIDDGYRVRALCEPGRDHDNLAGLPVERIVGDIRHAETLDRAVADTSTVFHLAAIYRFWAADPDLFYDVNVGGTMNVIRAARRAGCNRLVYTSTVGTIGVAETGRPASEDSLVHFEHLFGHYKRSKYLAEHEVLRAGAAGLPVVLVHPTFPYAIGLGQHPQVVIGTAAWVDGLGLEEGPDLPQRPRQAQVTPAVHRHPADV